MSDFAVVVPAVAQAAGRCRTVAADLSDELAAVRREANTVLSGDWSGVAARAFSDEWSAWEAGAREVVAGLERLAELLTVSGIAYAGRDDAVAHSLLRIAL
jgi:WXG100 family type VII secretion target